MTRTEFTKHLSELIRLMLVRGENPIIDYVKRSAEEQNRLFKDGKTKADGYKVLSAHQSGKAADIYFIDGDRLGDPKMGYEHWHSVWESWGGKPMIEWDKGHFQ